MEKRKQTGFVLRYEDVDRLSDYVDAGALTHAEAFAVVTALSIYSSTGELPERDELGAAAYLAFVEIKRHVDATDEKYRKRCETNKAAAEKRWGKSASVQEERAEKTEKNEKMHPDANACECIEMDANASESMQMHAKNNKSSRSSKRNSYMCEESIPSRRSSRRSTAQYQAASQYNQSDDDDGQTAMHAGMDELRAQCVSCGMAWGLRDSDIAHRLLQEYASAWIVEAISRAWMRGKLNWGYIKGILSSWRASGGIDGEEHKREDRREDTMLRHAYSAADFRRMVVDLDAEMEAEDEEAAR